jgi:FMN phosphatase YigB (HAD superfamily)
MAEQTLAEQLEQAAKEYRRYSALLYTNAEGGELLKRAALLTRAAALARAAEELADAAFDYHVHSELAPVVEGVKKTVRLLEARNTVRVLVSSEGKGE